MAVIHDQYYYSQDSHISVWCPTCKPVGGKGQV